jgi:hypothetical protein
MKIRRARFIEKVDCTEPLKYLVDLIPESYRFDYFMENILSGCLNELRRLTGIYVYHKNTILPAVPSEHTTQYRSCVQYVTGSRVVGINSNQTTDASHSGGFLLDTELLQQAADDLKQMGASKKNDLTKKPPSKLSKKQTVSRSNVLHTVKQVANNPGKVSPAVLQRMMHTLAGTGVIKKVQIDKKRLQEAFDVSEFRQGGKPFKASDVVEWFQPGDIHVGPLGELANNSPNNMDMEAFQRNGGLQSENACNLLETFNSFIYNQSESEKDDSQEAGVESGDSNPVYDQDSEEAGLSYDDDTTHTTTEEKERDGTRRRNIRGARSATLVHGYNQARSRKRQKLSGDSTETSA